MSGYNPGITALAGFTFQIKAFIAELANIQVDQTINYEIGDDVSVDNFSKLDELSGNISSSNYVALFQIKRKKVTEDTSKKVLYNWLLEKDADDYKLIVAEGYSIDDNFIKNKKSSDIYRDLSNEGSLNSIERKVYEKFKKNRSYSVFCKKVSRIRAKYTLQKDFSPDNEIYQNYQKRLFFSNKSVDVYEKRTKALCRDIEYELLEAIDKKSSFSISYEEITEKLDQIVRDINDSDYNIDYRAFSCEKNFTINENIKEQREYKQLKYCELNDETITVFLTNKLYYEDYKNYSLEHRGKIKIDNIESEAVQNYKETKEFENCNTPKELLYGTIKKQIKDTQNKMQSNGTYISLTSESNKKISWKE